MRIQKVVLELSPLRKNKIVLSDYPYEWDVQCRILMSDFSLLDIQVLEEILFSPLKISLQKMLNRFGCQEELLLKSLKKLEEISLVSIQEETLVIDKEKRKYFEFEISRFDPEFKPDMEFLQGLLKKVPIHVLPTWYSIPRSSNCIFDSIVEKYLLTPIVFQRYLSETNLGHPVLEGIVRDVFSSEELKISSSDLISKYNLSSKDFEELILLLEFNFICCLVFEKEGECWTEFVTPFKEWKEYLCFLHATEPIPIESKEKLEILSNSPFSFLEEMTTLLRDLPKIPLECLKSPAIEKLLLTGLAHDQEGLLVPSTEGKAWLEMSLEGRALFLYRHPNNRILHLEYSDRALREAEKSMKRVAHGQWVFFEDFLTSVMVPLSEESQIILKKTGRQWRYATPVYTEEEKKLLRALVFDWLYEFGIVSIGKCQGKDCFCLTEFGRTFFEDG